MNLQSENMDSSQIVMRKQKLVEVWNEFDQVQTATEESDEKSTRGNLKMYTLKR